MRFRRYDLFFRAAGYEEQARRTVEVFQGLRINKPHSRPAKLSRPAALVLQVRVICSLVSPWGLEAPLCLHLCFGPTTDSCGRWSAVSPSVS